MAEPLLDALGRPLGSLRVSVTDRCNLRCTYCMPEADYAWLPRESLLTFEELARLARLFASLGARKVRLTGGEPLLRRDLPELVRMLAHDPRIDDLALTTNGLLLSRQIDALADAGLGRVTVSLDTLSPERFLSLARSPRHADVLDGIEAVERRALGLKLNTVVMRGVNDDELVPLLRFAKQHGAELRFIEYMDVGGATGWSADEVVSRAEMLTCIGAEFGQVEEVAEPDSRAPAERFRLPDGQTFGIIASTTAPFCRTCDRSRITADGTWFLCLYAEGGLDLRAPLRDGAGDEELRQLIARHWAERQDRGAELRAQAPGRTPLYQLQMLRADPHREMHTRGG
ncbi:MAG TPA: GTP 3',8-cyclase MoaA [Gemmatimonadales bacterium]|nr:GTP 3',8-cyclase MoaA [Gemmatimonadales bacterium]HET9602874.1 GTP 3',8-cyclase MoaA [Gemmatimonadales bacterium]